MKTVVKKREVKLLPGKKAYYANGETPAEEQKELYKGKHYFTFAYEKTAFTVHEDDAFIKAWNDNQICEITLDVEESGASFLNFATYAELLAEAKFEGEVDYARNRFKYEASKPLTVTSLEQTAGL